MYGMFDKAQYFNAKLNSWDVSNVKNMDLMFAGAINSDQNLQYWTPINVISMKRHVYRFWNERFAQMA